MEDRSYATVYNGAAFLGLYGESGLLAIAWPFPRTQHNSLSSRAVLNHEPDELNGLRNTDSDSHSPSRLSFVADPHLDAIFPPLSLRSLSNLITALPL